MKVETLEKDGVVLLEQEMMNGDDEPKHFYQDFISKCILSYDVGSEPL